MCFILLPLRGGDKDEGDKFALSRAKGADRDAAGADASEADVIGG